MSWLRRLANTFRSERLGRDLEREISFHLAERADDLRAQGAAGDDAARRARAQFGNPAVQYERTRDMNVAGGVDALLRNMRLAARTLVRAPGFTVTVVVTLAIGIGANTAVFSAIDAVLLRPLPYPHGDRLVRLMETREGAGETRIAPVRLEDWQRLNTTFESISGHFTSDVTDPRGRTPERILVANVAPRFFEVLGVAPAMGRVFSAADHGSGPSLVAIMSHRLWRERGADPSVLERTAVIQGQTIATAGVMPPEFQFPGPDVDTWGPVELDAPWGQARSLSWYYGIGRLREGVTPEQARADLQRVQALLADRYPDTDAGIGIAIVRLKETVVGDARASLWLLYGSVTVLLLIACTNIAALLLARASRREQEVAVRYSLGASRRAVAMQVLAEATVLASAGAGLGLVVALAVSRAFEAVAPDLPRVGEIAIDGRILLYTVLTTVVVTLLCGAVPALRSARGGGSLFRSARPQASARQSLQWLLVGVQVALSVMLLSGAGLLLRTIAALSRVDAGFEPASVLTFRVSGRYGEESFDRTVQRLNRVLDTLAARPDILAASTASALPGFPAERQQTFELREGRPDRSPPLVAESRVVSPRYFEAMRIPVLAGELCRRPPDAQGAVAEVMVNHRFAKRYFPGRSAIGLHLTGGLDYLAENRHLPGAPPARIAGVVADARESGLDRDPVPTVYSCFSAPDAAPWIVLRTDGDPAVSAAAVRRLVSELEPTRSVYEVASLERRLEDAHAEHRLRTWLLTMFGAVALGLVCAGTYGTLSYAAGLRRREIALRLALGALRRDVVGRLVGTGIRIVGAGAACGLVLALLFTHTLSTMLYGVSASDPVTLSAVVAIVIAVAGLAALVPATRATFVPPMQVLREE